MAAVHDDERCEETSHEGTPDERQGLVSQPVAERIARTFYALADPTRVRILSVLNERETCVGDLATTLGMTLSAISHQLRLLRDLRIVRARRDGKHVYYALDDEHIHDLFERGLEHVKHT